PPQAPEWDHSDNPPPLLDIPAEAYADDEPWPEATAETHDYPGAAKSPTPAPTSRYLLPPVNKAIALLLAHPQLAASEAEPATWLNQDDINLRRLGRLLALLQQRPHYQLPQIIGHWRANHGASETELLAAIAGH